MWKVLNFSFWSSSFCIQEFKTALLDGPFPALAPGFDISETSCNYAITVSMITQITPHYARAQFCSDYFKFSILENFEREKYWSCQHNASRIQGRWIGCFRSQTLVPKKESIFQISKQKASRFRIMVVKSFLKKKMAGWDTLMYPHGKARSYSKKTKRVLKSVNQGACKIWYF